MAEHDDAVRAACDAANPTIFQNLRPGAKEEAVREIIAAFLRAVEPSEKMGYEALCGWNGAALPKEEYTKYGDTTIQSWQRAMKSSCRALAEEVDNAKE